MKDITDFNNIYKAEVIKTMYFAKKWKLRPGMQPHNYDQCIAQKGTKMTQQKIDKLGYLGIYIPTEINVCSNHISYNSIQNGS